MKVRTSNEVILPQQQSIKGLKFAVLQQWEIQKSLQRNCFLMNLKECKRKLQVNEMNNWDPIEPTNYLDDLNLT